MRQSVELNDVDLKTLIIEKLKLDVKPTDVTIKGITRDFSDDLLTVTISWNTKESTQDRWDR